MKKLLLWLIRTYSILIVSVSGSIAFAQNNSSFQNPPDQTNLEIMPEVDEGIISNTYDAIRNSSGTTTSVRDRYNQQASGLNTQAQVVTGVMTRDTILNYFVILLRFLMQVGMAIWSLMFIYVGYQYIMSVITGTSPETNLIRNAIIGILIIIFSYAIMRILTRAFLT